MVGEAVGEERRVDSVSDCIFGVDMFGCAWDRVRCWTVSKKFVSVCVLTLIAAN